MTDEKLIEKLVEADQSLSGKKRTKKKSLIGIDPLAWLKDGDFNDESVDQKSSENTEVIQENSVDDPEADIVIDNEVLEIIEKDFEEPSEENTEEITDQEKMEVEVTDMEIQQAETNTDQAFKLEGSITIADVSELHSQFKATLGDSKELVVDCSEVAGVDAAALQLLVAFVHETGNQACQLTWKEPSDSLKAAIQLTGLNNEFLM